MTLRCHMRYYVFYMPLMVCLAEVLLSDYVECVETETEAEVLNSQCLLHH